MKHLKSIRLMILIILLNAPHYSSFSQLGFGFQLSRSRTLNAPSESFSEFIGFELTADGRFEDSPLVFSFQVSIMNTHPQEKFFRTINDSQNSTLPFYNSYELSTYMIGLSYYPIKSRAVINPFVRTLGGFGLWSYEVTYGDRPRSNVILGYTALVPPTFLTSLTGRIGLGLDFSISNLFKRNRELDFAIQLSSSFNYASRVYYIDPNVLEGDNLVIGNLYSSQQQAAYAVEIGNLHRFAPKFFTFEIGLILRFFTDYEEDTKLDFLRY